MTAAEAEALKKENEELQKENEAILGLRLAWLKENDALKAENTWLRGKLALRGLFPPYDESIELDTNLRLDSTLRNFDTFLEAAPVRALLALQKSSHKKGSQGIRALEVELQVALASGDEGAIVSATASLEGFLRRLKAAYGEAIEARLRQEGVFDQCYAAIEAAGRCFCATYGAVWSVLGRDDAAAEAEGLGEYRRVVERVVVPELLSARPVQRSGDPVALYKSAIATLKQFRSIVLGEIGGTANFYVGPLKRLERVVEKSMLRHDEPGNASACCDIVRGMAVCHTMGECAAVVERVLDLERRGLIRVVRVKDRFLRSPLSVGWRDVLINFTIIGEETGHVVELQVVHEMMIMARRGLPNHIVYGRVRNAYEIIQKMHGGEHVAADALALAKFLELAGAGGELRSKGWMSDRSLSQWGGVTTDADSGKVTELRLREAGLANDVPVELAALDDLAVLDFRANPALAIPLGLDLLDADNQMFYAEKEQTQQVLQHLLLSDEVKASMQRDIDDRRKYGIDAPWLHKIFDRAGGEGWTFPNGSSCWFGEETDLGKWAGVTTSASDSENVRVLGLNLTDEHIRGVDSRGLADLSVLAECSSLRTLNLKGCILTDISGLGKCSDLQELNLDSCSQLVEVSALGSCSSLNTVDLRECKQLTDVSGLGKCSALQELNLDSCEQLIAVSALWSCESLRTLNLSSCAKLTDLSGLDSCSSLQTLDLGGCSSLSSLSGLGKSTTLSTLNLTRCESLGDISGLGNSKSLRSVHFDECASLADISALGSCASVRIVSLQNCGILTDLTVLGGCHDLLDLNLSGCSQLTSVSMLWSCTSLSSLNLDRCIKMEDIMGLEKCRGLKKLNLEGCGAIKAAPDLSSIGEFEARNLPQELLGWKESGYQAWPPPVRELDPAPVEAGSESPGAE